MLNSLRAKEEQVDCLVFVTIAISNSSNCHLTRKIRQRFFSAKVSVTGKLSFSVSGRTIRNIEAEISVRKPEIAILVKISPHIQSSKHAVSQHQA